MHGQQNIKKPEDVLIQLFPSDDECLSLETCTGRRINTLKKVKKVRQVGCKSRIASGCTVNKILKKNVYVHVHSNLT
jgi:hypothetical protein